MKLPDDIRSEINRLAHALSQWSFVEHRRTLLAEAAALMKAGGSREDVLRRLAETAPAETAPRKTAEKCDQYAQYAQAHPRARDPAEQ